MYVGMFDHLSIELRNIMYRFILNVNTKSSSSHISISRRKLPISYLLFLSSAVKEFLINDQVHILVLSARKMYSNLYKEYYRITWKLL